MISTNLDAITPAALPPATRDGAARVLFVHGNILGFRNVAAQLKHYAADRDDIDAVHIDLVAPAWLKVLGKSLPVPGGWDLHAYRYLLAWGRIIRGWFRRVLPLDRFDVVHMMTQTNAHAALSFAGRPGAPAFAVNTDSTTELEIREFGFPALPRAPYLAAERRLFDAADLVVTRNRWAAQSVRDDYGIPAARVHAAPNSIAVRDAHRGAVAHAADGPLRVAFVGNNWLRKGGDLVLAAQQQCAEDVELHVYGDRVQRDDRARNVVWHGRVPREQLLDAELPTMDAFVLASRYDMLPWAALEAAGAGLPIIAPRVGGIPEVVIDGTTGVLVESGDVDGIAAAYRTLHADRARAAEMGQAGRAHVAEHHNPDRTYPGVLDRLRDLADARQSPPVS